MNFIWHNYKVTLLKQEKIRYEYKKVAVMIITATFFMALFIFLLATCLIRRGLRLFL